MPGEIGSVGRRSRTDLYSRGMGDFSFGEKHSLRGHVALALKEAA
jgi:hypothetical protein